MAENLERKQKGEQFRILDPATPPVNPFKPNRNRFFGLTFILSLAFGGGIAYLKEYTDRSFHRVDDAERFLGFPVIGTLPRIEIRKAKGN
ncbi:MAG: hypothetical protein GTN76_08995 [Candidatus Aenigmarchaeota archaeon]|nr:hypothetical protein [Candidatus Aenigmarchaeota archaeon]